MSDDSDDDLIAIKKAKVFYGSLSDAAEKIRSQSDDTNQIGTKTAGTGLANIHTSEERLELDKFVDPHKEAMLAEFERRKRAKQLTLPTDDGEVKGLFRRLNQPICLFGEDKPDRRERLRAVLSTMDDEEAQKILRKEEAKPEKKEENATWYHTGDENLRIARLYIAVYALPRAKARLEEAKRDRAAPAQLKAIRIQESHKWVRSLTNQCSQIGDKRPITHCHFSPNSKLLATAGFSGLCKLWSIPDCKSVRTYRGHTNIARCIAFHPKSTLEEENWSPSILNLASGDQDGSVKLWSLDKDEPIDCIDGHQPYRISKIAFHPSGRFLATACFDHSWRLYDLEADEEVLFQEGHSKGVYDIDFQCDGSLALTAGMDCYGRVWDLRTGRCIMFLEGHQNAIYTCRFSPDGYRMATAGADNTCKLWDLRVRRLIYTLPAHNNLISAVRFDSTPGHNYMITSSYDETVKLWTNPGWQPLRTLTGHQSKVSCIDVSPDGKYVVTTCHDKTFKLWAPDL